MKRRMFFQVPTRGTLSHSLASATGWSLAQVIAQYGFRLVSNLIMTRLLFADAYGLMGMAVSVMTAALMFSNTGLSESVVSDRNGDDPRFLRAVWAIKILRGIVVAGVILLAALVLALLAPALAPPDTVYADPRLPWMVAMIALAPLLAGLESTSLELALRRIDAKRVALSVVAVQVAMIAVMVGAALVWPSVWTLMLGTLAGSLLTCLVSHLFFPGPRMAWGWDRAIAARVWHFGRWLLLSSGFGFVERNADKFYLASLLNAEGLGLYVIALVWTEVARMLVQMLNTRVSFPAFSETMRSAPASLPQIFRRVQSVIDALCIAGFLTLLLGGQELIDTIYPPAYSSSGLYVSLLSLVLLSIRFETLSSLLLSTGDSRGTMIAALIRAVGMVILLPLANRLLGTQGVVMVTALVPALGAPLLLHRLVGIFPVRLFAVDIAWLAALPAIAVLVFVTR